MFYALAFLFEKLQDLDSLPSRESINAMLMEAGFNLEEIRDTLLCLDGFFYPQKTLSDSTAHPRALRLFNHEEQLALPREVRGLLHFLSEQGSLSLRDRECVIHALMHLPIDEITVDNSKLLILLLMWLNRSELPVLIGDELLTALHGQSTLH